VPQVDANTLLSVARVFGQFKKVSARVGLEELVTVTPDSPEAWFDLASTRLQLGRGNEVLPALRKAIELSDARLNESPALATCA